MIPTPINGLTMQGEGVRCYRCCHCARVLTWQQFARGEAEIAEVGAYGTDGEPYLAEKPQHTFDCESTRFTRGHRPVLA